MGRIKKFRMKVIGVVVSLVFFGCFCGSFCSATGTEVGNVRQVTSLTGGIEFKGSKGSDSRGLNEKDVVRFAIFIYALAKNYVREFGFKEDNATEFIRGFLKSLTSDLNKNGFKLEIKDLINSNTTKEQVEAAERMFNSGNKESIEVTRSDFNKAKADVMRIAKECSRETKADDKRVNKAREDGRNSVLSFAKREIGKEIKNLRKEVSDENKEIINEKINKLKRMLNKGNKDRLKKYGNLLLKNKTKLYEELVPSLKERIKEIEDLDYDKDVKPLNKCLVFQYNKSEKKA